MVCRWLLTILVNLSSTQVTWTSPNLRKTNLLTLQLGYVGFCTMQTIMRTDNLASSESMCHLHNAASKLLPQDLQKCSTCQFGLQTNQSVPGSMSSAIKDRPGILSADEIHPGQLVFIDNFVSTTRGQKFKGYGIKEPNSSSNCGGNWESYRGGCIFCIFVDACTGFIGVEFQSRLNSFETLQAVKAFESIACDNGIIVSQYQSDNGSAFTCKALFKTHLHAQAQLAKLSAAGSYHQSNEKGWEGNSNGYGYGPNHAFACSNPLAWHGRPQSLAHGC